MLTESDKKKVLQFFQKQMLRMCSREYHTLKNKVWFRTTPPLFLLILIPLEILVLIYSFCRRKFWLLDPSPLEFPIIILKPWPNDRNITDNIIGPRVSCVSVGHAVGTCYDMLGIVGSNLKMVQFFMQHLWIFHDVVLVGSGSCNNVAPGHAH